MMPMPQGGPGPQAQAASPPPSPPQGGNISPLMAGQQVPNTGGPTPDQRVAGYMEQVRNISIMIDTLAGQFPDASEDLNNAKTALVNSMSKVATSMSQPSGAGQPPTF
jgi:hypothetical protein